MLFKSTLLVALLAAVATASIVPSHRLFAPTDLPVEPTDSATDLPVQPTATQAPDEPETTHGPHEYGKLCQPCVHFWTEVRDEINRGGNLTSDLLNHILEDTCKYFDDSRNDALHKFCETYGPELISR